MAEYNGWTNYETWAVNLWIQNEERLYEMWREFTGECWTETGDKHPNPFSDHSGNARIQLAQRLSDEYDDESHPVFAAARDTVYADLLNAALSVVNWHEIANSMLVDMETEADDEQYNA